MVDVTSPSRESLPYALSVLAFTFLILLCRQTASIWAIAAVPPVFVLVLFLGNRQKTGPYHPHSLRTAWYGAMINFLYVFTLLYLTSVGRSRELGLLYTIAGVGTTAALPTAAVLGRLLRDNRYEVLCISCVIASSCLMLVPHPFAYALGLGLTALFVTMGGNASYDEYLSDERLAKEGRRLTRAKFYGFGSVVEQMQMLVTIFACSTLVSGRATSALEGCTMRSASRANEPAYRWALLVCVALNAVEDIALLVRGGGCEQLQVGALANRRVGTGRSPEDGTVGLDKRNQPYGATPQCHPQPASCRFGTKSRRLRTLPRDLVERHPYTFVDRT